MRVEGKISSGGDGTKKTLEVPLNRLLLFFIVYIFFAFYGSL